MKFKEKHANLYKFFALFIEARKNNFIKCYSLSHNVFFVITFLRNSCIYAFNVSSIQKLQHTKTVCLFTCWIDYMSIAFNKEEIYDKKNWEKLKKKNWKHAKFRLRVALLPLEDPKPGQKWPYFTLCFKQLQCELV